MNPREILRRRTKLLAERRSQAPASLGLPTLVFALGSERYGLPMSEVSEVLPFARCAPLPGAPQWLLGVMSIRGDAFSVMELGGLLGLPPVADRASGFVLAFRRGARIALRVDSVLDIKPVLEAELTPPPQAQAETLPPALKGLAPDRTMILDLDALLSRLAAMNEAV